jgi:hypothetical protein
MLLDFTQEQSLLSLHKLLRVHASMRLRVRAKGRRHTEDSSAASKSRAIGEINLGLALENISSNVSTIVASLHGVASVHYGAHTGELVPALQTSQTLAAHFLELVLDGLIKSLRAYCHCHGEQQANVLNALLNLHPFSHQYRAHATEQRQRSR